MFQAHLQVPPPPCSLPGVWCELRSHQADFPQTWKEAGKEMRGGGGRRSSPGSLLGRPHLPILPLLSGWPSPHHSLLGPRSHAFPLFLQAQQSWPLGCYHPVRLPFPEAPTPTPLYVYAPWVLLFWVGFLLLGHWLMLSALSLSLGLEAWRA